MQVDVIQYFLDFYNLASRGCYTLFITLIFIVSSPMLVKKFRPVSLIGTWFNIIVKFLANRLVLLVTGVVSSIDSMFAKVMQILDSLVIINELVDWCNKKKIKCMIFKNDFEKAYDSLSLMGILESVMGFFRVW